LPGDVGLSITTRILGLLVASIGMQLVITGLSNVVIHTLIMLCRKQQPQG